MYGYLFRAECIVLDNAKLYCIVEVDTIPIFVGLIILAVYTYHLYHTMNLYIEKILANYGYLWLYSLYVYV